MKIRFTKLALPGLLFVILFLQGCNKDKDVVKGAFQSGVLVANEGQFKATNGDVTYYNPSSALLEQNIYKTVNGSFAGDVLQSVFLDGDAGYLVINNDNKIEIIDDNTFKLQQTFSDPALINPRYLQVINGKAYISNWGAYNEDGNLTNSFVLVVDLKTLSVVTTIPTDPGAENLLYNGEFLFVANFNYGGSNTITVIDPSTDKSIKTISVNDGPSGMVEDVNRKIWVITTGSDAELAGINPVTFAVEDTFGIDAFANGDLQISPDKKTLIYSSGFAAPSIYKVQIDAAVAPVDPWFVANDITAIYALGVDPKTGDVYLGDALNFASAGEVYVYGADGIFKTKFAAGISPGQFIFR